MIFTILAVFLYIFASTAIHITNAYKILGIFPIAAQSHFSCDNAVMKSLIEAGHEVTIITPFPDQALAENYTSVIDISKDEFIYLGQLSFNYIARLNIYQTLEFGMNLETPFCNKVINLPEIQKLLNSNEKLYDVVFIEMLVTYRCYFAIPAKKSIPIIGVITLKSWSNADYEVGNPHNPAYVPYDIIGSLNCRSFYDRFWNTWSHIVAIWHWHSRIKPMLNEFHKNHTKQLGSLEQYNHVRPALIFVNNHPSLLAKPTSPNTIEIGGIHIKKAKPLPQNVKKFIDEAEQGVILFTFGSVTRAALLPAEIQEEFRSAFAEIPQRVIWKFEEQMDNLPDNVMLMKWLPQRDILEHSNVKAFISHCGQGGTYEAIYTGTPVISCPLFGDQPGNAVILENMEVAVHLDINTVTKQSVLHALNLIMNDTKYYRNMQKLSKVFKDRPMTPQQSVVYWTEYVIRHEGAPHLTTAAVHLNWFQYSLLDVICAFVLCIFVFVCSFCKLTKFVTFHFTTIRKKLNQNIKNKFI